MFFKTACTLGILKVHKAARFFDTNAASLFGMTTYDIFVSNRVKSRNKVPL